MLEDPKASDVTTETNTQTMIMAEADTGMSAETDMETGLDTQETYDPAITNPEQMDPAGDVKTPDWDETQSADLTVDGSVDADMNDTTTAEADITADTEMGVGGPDYASETDAMADLAMQGTIADLAAEDPRFTTFVALVEQAGLTDKLDGDAEYTVFAPTNAAFEKLDPELVTKLKSGEANDKLTSILKAHIVEGETLSSNIADGEMSVATLADADISVNKSGDSVTIGNATVVAADIDASNGVIHAVDTVIMPDDES